MINPSVQNFNCPLCGTTVHVKKVSVLVREGTQFSKHITSTINTDLVTGLGFQFGKQQSNLAQLLSPPKEPKKRIWFLTYIKFYWIFSLCALLLYGITWPIWGLGSSSHSLLDGETAVGIGVIIFTLLILLTSRKISQRKARLAAEMTAYQMLMNKWEKLYFCTFHDIVFLPANSLEYVPVSEMSRLLLRPW